MFTTMKILKAQEAEKAEAEDREDMDADGAGKDGNMPHASNREVRRER